MGDRVPRAQMLAEMLHAHGLIDAHWDRLSAREQLDLASAAEDYDDAVGHEEAAVELAVVREELEELKREREEEREKREEEREKREEQDVAIVEDGEGGAEITFRGKRIEGVTHARLEWDEKEPTRLALRLRSNASPPLEDLAERMELRIEMSLAEIDAMQKPKAHLPLRSETRGP